MKARVVHLSVAHRARDPRILHKEAASTARAGYETYVVARHDRRETKRGAHIIPLPDERASGWSRLKRHRAALRIVAHLKPDILHFHDPELIPICYVLKRKSGPRVIYDMHEDYGSRSGVQGLILRLLERWCFRWIDHVVLAEKGYEEIVRGSRAPHTVVLNYFLPHDGGISTGSPPKEPFTLLYAGVQGYGRGLGTILQLARMIRKRGLPWRIRLAGVCYIASERQRAEARIKRLDVGEYIDLVGWDRYLPWEELITHYERAHVGLALYRPHRNYKRSIPTKFYEYLYYGLPILCSDHGLMPEFVESHNCGAAVRHDDPEQIISVLEAWSTDWQSYATLSANARAAAEQYRWRTMEQRLIDLYREMTDLKR